MKTLETLLKIASKKVEESHEDIGKLLHVMQNMDKRQADLNSGIESEYEVATMGNDSALLSFAGAFSLKSNDEILDIKQARIDAQKLMAKKRELLRQRFAEQKRYEILLDRKRVELKKERQKKQQAELDDLSIMRQQTKG
ncbi:MAG: flagellar export protein FliJ [Alphaproteobacteria bacterium]|jgi:flagellar export protein FliJ